MYPEATRVMNDARSRADSVQGGAFNQALYSETMTHAEYEYASMQDYRHAMFHANNAITAANGGTYEPAVLSEWQLPADKVDELSSARERLVAVLTEDNKQAEPQLTAQALASFNCWVEQQRENFQPTDIANCRDSFYQALEALEARRAGFPEAVSLASDVFFDFDRYTIRPDAQAALNDVAQLLVQDTSVQILVWGFTDTAGPADYNQGLSERRANAVADYLAQQGVDRSRMTTEGFGETRLAVQTPDNTPEPRNRRVEIRRR
jgi:OOP family OmpA-OmpF porin